MSSGTAHAREALPLEHVRVKLTGNSIVFSTWRLTLNVIETGLNQAGIQSARFDGKVPLKERQSAVKRFRTDPNTRIMLLTLSSGAVGSVIR